MTKAQGGRLGGIRCAEVLPALKAARQRDAIIRRRLDTAALRRLVRALRMDRRELWVRAVEGRAAS